MNAAKRALPRSQKSGKFTASSPLDDSTFLGGVRLFVKAVDSLVPLLRSMADRGDQGGVEVIRLRMVATVLDGMASNMSGQLVARGERLLFPPPVDFIRAGFDWGDPNDHDVLSQCVAWHHSATKVQWFFAQMGQGRKPPAKALAAVKNGDEDASFAVMAYMACTAMDHLKALLVDRLKQSSDKHYLKDAKATLLLFPMFKAAAKPATLADGEVVL